MFGFLTDFQNFSRVFRPTNNLFRVVVDRMTRVFRDSDATWAALIYQQSCIKNRFKHLWWTFFYKKLLTTLVYFQPIYIFWVCSTDNLLSPILSPSPSMKLTLTQCEGAYLTKRLHPVHQQEQLVEAMLLRSSRTNRSS